ncbi:hypothetical protein MMPV_000959 [Pyropia vietnamensis]
MTPPVDMMEVFLLGAGWRPAAVAPAHAEVSPNVTVDTVHTVDTVFASADFETNDTDGGTDASGTASGAPVVDRGSSGGGGVGSDDWVRIVAAPPMAAVPRAAAGSRSVDGSGKGVGPTVGPMGGVVRTLTAVNAVGFSGSNGCRGGIAMAGGAAAAAIDGGTQPAFTAAVDATVGSPPCSRGPLSGGSLVATPAATAAVVVAAAAAGEGSGAPPLPTMRTSRDGGSVIGVGGGVGDSSGMGNSGDGATGAAIAIAAAAGSASVVYASVLPSAGGITTTRGTSGSEVSCRAVGRRASAAPVLVAACAVAAVPAAAASMADPVTGGSAGAGAGVGVRFPHPSSADSGGGGSDPTLAVGEVISSSVGRFQVAG